MSKDCRLYIITPPRIDDLAAFSREFDAALGAGDVACVQLRLKPDGAAASDDAIVCAAEKLAPIAGAHDVAFLINDRPDLAKKTGADGVHIGQSDGTYDVARTAVGKRRDSRRDVPQLKRLGPDRWRGGRRLCGLWRIFSDRNKKSRIDDGRTGNPRMVELRDHRPVGCHWRHHG